MKTTAHKQIVDAVFENGVFRPLTAVSIQEGQQVRLLLEAPAPPEEILALAGQVYEGLSEEQIDEVEQIAFDRRDFFEEEPP